jgi:hypothetical protein
MKIFEQSTCRKCNQQPAAPRSVWCQPCIKKDVESRHASRKTWGAAGGYVDTDPRPTGPPQKESVDEMYYGKQKPTGLGPTRSYVACECEAARHGERCDGVAARPHKTVYGTFNVCAKCSADQCMPKADRNESYTDVAEALIHAKLTQHDLTESILYYYYGGLANGVLSSRDAGARELSEYLTGYPRDENLDMLIGKEHADAVRAYERSGRETLS